VRFCAVVLSLFPEMFPGPLGCSLAGTALKNGLWSLETLNIRDFSTDKHRTVDASPYGGGTGMVLRPDIVHVAVEAAKAKLPGARVIYPSPRGVPFTQKLAKQLAGEQLIFVCGRF
jgi:tRNA (guanine37-N1)-methyltransferase